MAEKGKDSKMEKTVGAERDALRSVIREVLGPSRINKAELDYATIYKQGRDALVTGVGRKG